eukprot:Skav221636  [mRNA]  locus=scaffold7171:8611:12033:+ [translate_table: standard]
MTKLLSDAQIETVLDLAQSKFAESETKAHPPADMDSTTASSGNPEKKKKRKKESTKSEKADDNTPLYDWNSISALMQDFQIDLEEAKLVLTDTNGPPPDGWTEPGSTEPQKKPKASKGSKVKGSKKEKDKEAKSKKDTEEEEKKVEEATHAEPAKKKKKRRSNQEPEDPPKPAESEVAPKPMKRLRKKGPQAWPPLRLRPFPHRMVRTKIQSIVRRGDGIPDADCPDDPESVQFWVTRKAKYNETATLTQSQQMKLKGKATGAFIGGLSSKVAPNHVIHIPALGKLAGAPGTDELLATSDSLLSAPSGSNASGKAKAKAKGKAKARPRGGVTQQHELTPGEKKTASRSQLKKEINSANSVLLDLPVGNDLRRKLESTRDEYEDVLDQSPNRN